MFQSFCDILERKQQRHQYHPFTLVFTYSSFKTSLLHSLPPSLTHPVTPTFIKASTYFIPFFISSLLPSFTHPFCPYSFLFHFPHLLIHFVLYSFSNSLIPLCPFLFLLHFPYSLIPIVSHSVNYSPTTHALSLSTHLPIHSSSIPSCPHLTPPSTPLC